MLTVGTENTRVNGKVAIWLFQAQLGKLATSRLCGRIIDWVCALAESQWLAPENAWPCSTTLIALDSWGEEGNP
jgi:hypothetical protein